MDVIIPINHAHADSCPCKNGSVSSSTTYWLRKQVKNNLTDSLPIHEQGKLYQKPSVVIRVVGKSREIKISQALGEDQIEPTLPPIDTNVLLDHGCFEQRSVYSVDYDSSDEVSQSLESHHLASRQSVDSSPRLPVPAAESENFPGSKGDSEPKRVDRSTRSKDLRGKAKMQILNSKPDSEVSATTRKRRAEKEKQRKMRQREKDSYETRVQNLEINGAESKIPCNQCRSRGVQCRTGAGSPPSISDITSESGSSAFNANLPNLTSNALHVSKCVPPQSALRVGLDRTSLRSAGHKYRSRCRRSINAPKGTCDRKAKATCSRLPRKPSLSPPCLNCIKKKIACNFPSGDTEAVVQQNTRSRGRKDINSFHEYSKEWYKAKSRSEKTKILQFLMDTENPYLRSGIARHDGPCTRCISLGLRCRIIKPDSIAFTLSPKTTCCSNCLGGVGRSISGPWNEIKDCYSTKEGQIPSITSSNISPSNLQFSKPSLDIQSTKIPLEDSDDGFDNQLRGFNPNSDQHIPHPLPKEALDPDEVSKKAEEMYCYIRRLSDSAFILSDQVICRQPLSECEISQLEILTANQPFPTVLDALRQLLGVSNSGDLRSRILEFSLEAIPYMQVVRAVTSMTVNNVIFQKNPFDHDLQSVLSTRMVDQFRHYNHQEADRTIQWHHVETLDKDANFKAKLRGEAKVAGELIWNILEPFITLGLSNPTPSVIKNCRAFCSNIANFGCELNAEIKARCIQAQISSPISGDSFDKDCFEGSLGSNLQRVQLALSLGIKIDHASGPPTVYAKSKVIGV